MRSDVKSTGLGTLDVRSDVSGTGLGYIRREIRRQRHWPGAYYTCDQTSEALAWGIIDVRSDIRGTGLEDIRR